MLELLKPGILSFMRHALSGGGGVLVANGYATNDGTTEAVGAVVTLISFIWSVVEKARAKKAA